MGGEPTYQRLLANFAAAVAMKQLSCGRHFLIENPAGSEIFQLPSFQKLGRSGRVVSVNIAQCALGLRINSQPIRKLTTLWASSWILLEPFRGLKCRHTHHGILQGKIGSVNKTRMAQVWPHEMCVRITQGLINLIQKRVRSIMLMTVTFGGCIFMVHPMIVEYSLVQWHFQALMKKMKTGSLRKQRWTRLEAD